MKDEWLKRYISRAAAAILAANDVYLCGNAEGKKQMRSLVLDQLDLLQRRISEKLVERATTWPD